MLKTKLNLDTLEAREVPAVITVSGSLNDRFASAFAMNHVNSSPDLVIVRTSQVHANVLAMAPPTMTQRVVRTSYVETNTVPTAQPATMAPTTLQLTEPAGLNKPVVTFNGAYVG